MEERKKKFVELNLHLCFVDPTPTYHHGYGLSAVKNNTDKIPQPPSQATTVRLRPCPMGHTLHNRWPKTARALHAGTTTREAAGGGERVEIVDN
ncbi:hypothetical protein MTR_2g091100 [Medicago truncatula]|uniref:Uncharacterized protein n=1 Tax=Medicago truncatula TaxID=3880 RepID=A0A072VBS5_MEDTR|nr:hypothetical protein MTR_2g091100 [Medicago truncatula]